MSNFTRLNGPDRKLFVTSTVVLHKRARSSNEWETHGLGVKTTSLLPEVHYLHRAFLPRHFSHPEDGDDLTNLWKPLNRSPAELDEFKRPLRHAPKRRRPWRYEQTEVDIL